MDPKDSLLFTKICTPNYAIFLKPIPKLLSHLRLNLSSCLSFMLSNHNFVQDPLILFDIVTLKCLFHLI